MDKYIYTKDLLNEVNAKDDINIKDHTLRRYIRELENIGYDEIAKDEQGARIFNDYDREVIKRVVNKVQLSKKNVKTSIEEVLKDLEAIKKIVDNRLANIDESEEVTGLLKIVIEQNNRLYNRIEELEQKIDDMKRLDYKEESTDQGAQSDVHELDNSGDKDKYTSVHDSAKDSDMTGDNGVHDHTQGDVQDRVHNESHDNETKTNEQEDNKKRGFFGTVKSIFGGRK